MRKNVTPCNTTYLNAVYTYSFVQLYNLWIAKIQINLTDFMHESIFL